MKCGTGNAEFFSIIIVLECTVRITVPGKPESKMVKTLARYARKKGGEIMDMKKVSNDTFEFLFKNKQGRSNIQHLFNLYFFLISSIMRPFMFDDMSKLTHLSPHEKFIKS